MYARNKESDGDGRPVTDRAAVSQRLERFVDRPAANCRRRLHNYRKNQLAFSGSLCYNALMTVTGGKRASECRRGI